MLELIQQGRVSTQTNVLPQLVARAFLLELSQDQLEEAVRDEADRNPVLELTERDHRPWSAPGYMVTARDSDVFASLAAPVSLRQDLSSQLRAICPPDLLHPAEYIIESLDERGYLPEPLFCLADDLCLSEVELAGALAVVQALEPPGIGARDLVECLELQVCRMAAGEAPPGLLEFLATEFAGLVEQGSTRELSGPRGAGMDVYMTFIRNRLYPYPADLYRPVFASEDRQLPIQEPDVVVEERDGALRIDVPVSRRLSLRVDSAYERLARSAREKTADSTSGIRELVSHGREFIANLTHRHSVIARVAAAVLKEQEDFLTLGPRALKPFTKKELADGLGLHESTVCRATRGKTIMLPDGEVVPFDVFFEDALPAKVTLAQLVRREDPTRPLRDGELARQLAELGHTVARRTVSKYRASLGIPPASRRKIANRR